jgi:hypothetical protein
MVIVDLVPPTANDLPARRQPRIPTPRHRAPLVSIDSEVQWFEPSDGQNLKPHLVVTARILPQWNFLSSLLAANNSESPEPK